MEIKYHYLEFDITLIGLICQKYCSREMTNMLKNIRTEVCLGFIRVKYDVLLIENSIYEHHFL